MSRPTILVNGHRPPPLGAAEDGEVAIGTTAALTLESTSGITSVVWAFEKVPVGSTAAPTPTTGLSAEATFDLAGEYILTCRSQSGRRDRVVLRVYTAARQLLPVQADDSTETVLDAQNRMTTAVDALVATASQTLHVTNIATLRAVTPEANAAAIVAGRVTRGDRGGGVFYYDASDTTTVDDGALTIVTSGGHRFKRLVEDEIRAAWFGADASGVLESRTAIQAAMDAAATRGIRVVRLDAGRFRIPTGTKLVPPSNLTLRGEGRFRTVLVSELTPDLNVKNATIFAEAGTATTVTALASSNTVGARTISVNASIPAGSIILVNDTVSGAGLRTMSYDVEAVSGSGPYTLTLDRPVLIQYGTGDAVGAVPSQPTGIVLEDFAIEGSATRFVEIVSARGCVGRRLRLSVTAGASHDIMASWDVGGRDCVWDDLDADGGGIAADCIAFEGHENGTLRVSKARRANSYGIVLHDAVHVTVEHCRSRANGFGLVVTADGTVKGCLGVRVVGGSYLSNTTQGIAVINGSRDTRVDGADCRFNPIGFAITGDCVGVVATAVNLSEHTTNAISVGSGASGVLFRGVDLSGSSATVPVSAAGDLEIDGATIRACKQIGVFQGRVVVRGLVAKCNPAAPQNVFYLSSGSPAVSLKQSTIECASTNCNVLSVAVGTLDVDSTTIRQVDGATGVIGLYNSGGLLRVGQGVNPMGCSTPLLGAGGTTTLVSTSVVTSMASPS